MGSRQGGRAARFGVGYEWLKTSYFEPIPAAGADSAAPETIELRGFQLVNFQFGWDHRLSDTFRLGPYMSLGIGHFSSPSPDPFELSGGFEKHAWLTFGVRGIFSPF